MACVSCGSGMHFECITVNNDGECCCLNDTPVAEEIEDEPSYKNRTYKTERSLKDQQSTGRKRAAKLYPLDGEAPCEWLGLKFAGGGSIPIVGCSSGKQEARHHGPDKNTLNNDKGNVHRICTKCHNRWHTRNDPTYVAGEIKHYHDERTKASVADTMESELYWARNKTVKAKD